MNWTCPLCQKLFVFAEKKPHHNGAILEHLYWGHELLSCQKVAGLFGICRRTIGRWMARLGLKKMPNEDRLGELSPRYNKKANSETRQKLSEAHKGKGLGAANPMFGKTHSKEARRKMSEGCKRRWQDPEHQQRISEVRSGSNNPLWKPRVKRTCLICGEEFEIIQGKVAQGGGRFCSNACVGRWLSREKSGSNSPHWKGGRFPYGPLWSEQRKRARNRDKYTCQRCGVTEEELGHELSVHHIRSIREFNDNSLENLICLCDINDNGCHRHCEVHPEDCPEPRKAWLLTESVATGECYNGL